MGNSSSSGRGHQEDTVDFGHLTPQGVYTAKPEWNQNIVGQLIVERKLAPFYRPLEDYEDSWDDDQILAARKELPDPNATEGDAAISRAESVNSANSRSHSKRPSTAKEVARQPEAAIYRGAVECPICFLYYPPNINHSRCCDQAICTECFVQIKRADPTTTHLVSEPASCPYCVQENFGVVYTPPTWRAGIGSDGAASPPWQDSSRGMPSPTTSPNAAMKRRRRSFGPDSPEVVTIDHIRPDWEAKLNAVRAAVTRRANRRIIMRQVGDRLIPVGVTSGRVHALPTGEDGQPQEGTEGGADRGSRRSRRRGQNQDLNQFLGMNGPDLEELMVMEAMRLSLVEHEEQQRREREAKAKEQANAQNSAPEPGETLVGSSATGGASSPPSSATGPDTDGSTSTLTSPGLQNASEPVVANGDAQRASRSRNTGHGQSLSIDLPSSESGSGGAWKRRSSVSPYRVSAALRSAASTASALASSPSEDVPSPSRRVSGEGASSSAGPSRTTDDTPRMAANIPLPPESSEFIPDFSTSSIVPPASEPVAINRDVPSLPRMHHTDSFASSIDIDGIPTYDPLPSAPGSAASSFSHKPLLASPSLPDALSSSNSGNNSSQILSSSQVL
ncbi:SNF1-interacting protein [Steccherinum ochraceum]|uniref:SNF1-interacting protein n=1 Tax=Steccherinum ochraceum TaxID=92696 RepID=A0A4R0R0W0_9APHY|nr:SNF1-interacting protein [Steccherinum ochraceum]